MQKKYNVFKIFLLVYIMGFLGNYLWNLHTEGYSWNIRSYFQIFSFLIILLTYERNKLFFFFTSIYIVLCYFEIFTFSIIVSNNFFFTKSFKIPLGNIKNHFAIILLVLSIYNWKNSTKIIN
jgi:hypothetical protein